MPPHVERTDPIHVFVSDRATAERRYRDVLGFQRLPELQFCAADGGPVTLQDASGNVRLALFERPAKPCRSTIALAASAQQFVARRAHLQTHLGQAPRWRHALMPGNAAARESA